MKSVFIVRDRISRAIVGVFSRKEKAENYINNDKGLWLDEFVIDTCE